MAIKVNFQLFPKDGQFDYVLSHVKRMHELALVMGDRDAKIDIYCFATVNEDNSERTANLCGKMCNIDGLEKIKISTTLEPDTPPTPLNHWERFLPHIPMICSTLVTFFVVFGVVYETLKNWSWIDMFVYAGIPAIATFLLQFALTSQQYRFSQAWERVRKG